MHACIVNVATRPGDLRGQSRLAASLKAYDIPLLKWTNEWPPESPSHVEMPYAFKTYAMQEARRRGFVAALWCDASVWFVRDPRIVLERITQDGYYMPAVGGPYVLGEWASDRSLNILRLERDDIMQIKLVIGNFWGLDFRSETGREILQEMLDRTKDGTMIGPWTNADGKVSADSRVRGHRHDMVAMTITLLRLGLDCHATSELIVPDTDKVHPESIVALARGMS